MRQVNMRKEMNAKKLLTISKTSWYMQIYLILLSKPYSNIKIGLLFYLCLVLTGSTCSAGLYGAEKAESCKAEKDDFAGRNCGESIPKFIDRVVNPDDDYIRQCKKTIDSVAELMRSKLVPYKVAATVKGGSLGKGTAVKQMADADLLFPLGDISSVKDLKDKLPEILKVLQSSLDRSGHQITAIQKTPFTIQFKINVEGTFQEVDLLPIIDLKIKTPTKTNLKPIYEEMRKNEFLRDNYMKCLAFLQVNFVSQVPEKVKRAIRLLKHWIKTKKHAMKSYGAELLIIKVYEELGSSRAIKEKELIESAFEKLSNLKTLKVSWNIYYDVKSFPIPSPPYILDPAFPFHNLIRQKTGGIDEQYVHLERDAKKILKTLKSQDY